MFEEINNALDEVVGNPSGEKASFLLDTMRRY
jgi:hypothetical protein